MISTIYILQIYDFLMPICYVEIYNQPVALFDMSASCYGYANASYNVNKFDRNDNVS